MAITLISKPIHWNRVNKQSQGDLEHCSGRGGYCEDLLHCLFETKVQALRLLPGCGRLWERHR